jgi:hypothetical protein
LVCEDRFMAFGTWHDKEQCWFKHVLQGERWETNCHTFAHQRSIDHQRQWQRGEKYLARISCQLQNDRSWDHKALPWSRIETLSIKHLVASESIIHPHNTNKVWYE